MRSGTIEFQKVIHNMPAVRDISWTFESVTTDAGITIPMPAYEQNDLLLAFIQSDTGTPALTSAGWTQVFTRTNTCSLTVMRKIATASEPATVTFASAVNETYNGAIVSVRDVDTTTPINISNDTTQVAAAKYTFQQVTTTRNNCLIFYAGANSGTGVPSIIEGPVTGILGADGAAESQGIGWGMQRTAGLTPNNVTCSNVATGAGVKAVIAVNPPVAGATVIPAHCAADASIYVDPLNGVTAYNGNAAVAATADTLFGTSLNSVTAGDATVAAAADTGLNSFHSTARVTTISASANWSGVALDLAAGNVVNTTGKNVLVHIGPSTSGQTQRFPTVAANRKGVAFGMLSTAGNWKAWYVHGNGTPWGASKDVPLVINSSNTSGVLQTTGSLNAGAVDAFGFWVSSTGVTTTIWQLSSLWVLDTTTICGGIVDEPIDIPGFVLAASTGHERRSVIQQGSSQALVLQPVQFGDGGTNGIYLDLDATAIEFPRQYDLLRKEINYCSADNVAGITYYAGATDTIKHRNSVISSASRYHWRIHASSSALATYDFSGLSIIGAGDVVLRPVATFTNMSFANCGRVTQNGAALSSCTFTGTRDGAALLSDDLVDVQNCTFIFDVAGHGIEATTAGTYTFTGNTFTGYGADGTTNAAFYNNSGGAITLNITGGGSTPTVRNGAGASTTINNAKTLLLTGLASGSKVKVFRDSDGVELAGTNSSSTSFQYDYNYTGDTVVDIVIVHLDYEYLMIPNITLGVSGLTVPVQQRTDRNYSNP